jgi:hypothetical protein
MIKAFALVTVFAVSLFAFPSKSTTNIVPLPTCPPNCPDLPWQS